MRTNIDIDDTLMSEAQRLSRLPTKRAVVEAGLQSLIAEEKRRERQRALLDLEGAIDFAEDLDTIRSRWTFDTP